MKLVPYDKTKIYWRGYKPTKNYEILMRFVESKIECVKIEDYPHTSIDSCQASFSSSIKRYRLTNVVRCSRYKGELYLIRVNT